MLEYILRLKDEASKEAEKAAKSISRSLEKAQRGSQLFAGALSAVSGAIVAAGAVGVNYAGELESLTIAMSTVTGSIEEAEEAMKVIKRTAQESPFFETTTLARFVQLMAAAGQETKTAVDTGIAFGDVMAAFGKGNAELSRMGNTISQVIGKGRADVVDFKELVNAGWVSVRKDVAEAMEVTMAEFEEMVSAGEIGYDQIREAANKFTGSADAQSKTFQALTQRMSESFQTLLADLVVDYGIFDGLKNAMNELVSWVDSNQDTIKQFLDNTIKWLIDNLPLLIGIIAGGLTPALVGLAGSFAAAMIPLLPFIAAGALLGVTAGVIIEQLGGWQEAQRKVIEVINVLVGVYNAHLQPALNELWNIIKNKLIPELKKLWDNISPILIPALKLLAQVLGVTVVAGLKIVIQFLTDTINRVSTAIGWFNDFVDTIKSIPGSIRAALEEAKNLLNKLNPFHRESPSLVDNVISGIDKIKKEYKSLANINLPSINSQLAPAFTGNGSGGVINNSSFQAPITINATLNNDLDAFELAQVIGFELSMRSQF